VKTYDAVRVPAAALRGRVIAVARTLARVSAVLRVFEVMNPSPSDNPDNDKRLVLAIIFAEMTDSHQHEEGSVDPKWISHQV
jgi:hypothetical protein